jgi:uncharacterized membrane protein YphA (DoxX/SURF4 family)
MSALVPRHDHGGAVCLGALLIIASHAADAHERFIPHTPTALLHETFFQSLNPDMLTITLRGAFVMGMLMALWLLRQPLATYVEQTLLRHLPGRPKQLLRLLVAFLLDQPVAHPWFSAAGEWTRIFCLRCLALVLIFSASRQALVIPSYPLDPSTLGLFQWAQVVLAAGILTQTLLPVCGALLVGLFCYQLLAFDWIIALDMLPVLLIAGLYLSSPWNARKRATITIPPWQIRGIRLGLGVGCFVLGWMKIYNAYLTVGVADNFPAVMDDPLIQLFSLGTTTLYRRECWIIAFAMAEIMTGFLLLMGVFCRVWCLLLIGMFTKLMVVDFGWAELPHLYFIGLFLVLLCSNHLTDEFGWLEARAAQAAREGRLGWRLLIVLGAAAIIALLVVYPGLYVLTKIPRPVFL